MELDTQMTAIHRHTKRNHHRFPFSNTTLEILEILSFLIRTRDTVIIQNGHQTLVHPSQSFVIKGEGFIFLFKLFDRHCSDNHRDTPDPTISRDCTDVGNVEEYFLLWSVPNALDEIAQEHGGIMT